MKKLLALLLCVVMLVPMAAMADDGRIHITYSFWGNQTEAESVQKALDEFNAMQDKIFVEPMQIPNEEYTQTLVNYAIAGQLPDCGMVNENSVLYFARNGVMADVSKMYEGEALQPMECITFKDGDATKMSLPAESGILVSNPPYGQRMMEQQSAQRLYAALGRHLKFAHQWKKYFITSEPEFEHFFGRRCDKKRKFYNGKIKCDYYMFTDNSRRGGKK